MRVLLLALALAACSSLGSGADLPDPLPLRRVLLPPERLEAELKRVGDGVLVRMPRAEFEKLVQEAARAASGRESPPRLIEARYRASLTDAPSLAGTVQWKLRNPGAGAALLRLAADAAGFNLALRGPRFENRDAVLSEFPFPGGTAPALLVDGPGDHTLTAEWTCRAEPRPDGILAELRLPPCLASVVELDLPVDCALSGPEGAMISGPLPAENAARRVWRVAAGGRAVLPLLVRRPGSGEPAVFVRQKSVHRLTPDGLEASHSFLGESAQGDVRDLVLEHDPALRPLDVSGPDVERWESRAGNPPLVAVRLRRPVREFALEVKGLAPLAGERGKPGRWASPWMSLRDAVPRGEQLEVWLHPRLEAGAWDAGDFLLAESSMQPGAPPMRRLVLQGGGVSSGKSAPRRPSLAVRSGGVSFHAAQHSEWRLQGDGMEFSSRIAYRVRQGLLFQLAASLPPGWEAVAVDTVPAGLLRSWSARGGKALVAELRRPLEAGGEEASLVVRLRPAKAGPVSGRDLPFPDAAPLGARHREGGLAIDWDEQAFKGAARTLASTSRVPGDAAGISPLADLYYPFQGQAPVGVLRLEPRTPRLLASAQVDVAISGGRARQDIRLALEAEGGRPASVEVRLEGPPPEWRTEAGPPPRTIERRPDRDVARALAGLAARSPLAAAALALARPRGAAYVVHFSRPLVPGKPLVLRASRLLEQTGPSSRPRWRVPLPEVSAGRMEGGVAVSLAGGELAAAETTGLRDDPRPRPGAWRSWRYGAGGVALKLFGRGARPSTSTEAQAGDARLVTVLSPEGVLRHTFSFRLTAWPGRVLPVQLPPGARLESASADGRWLEARADEEGVARLPVPVGGAAGIRFEIRYEADPASGLFPRLEAMAPVLPATPSAVARLWLMPPGVRPVSDTAVAALPGTAGEGAGGRLRYPADVLRLGPVLPLSWQPVPAHAGRPEALAEAAAGIRNRRAGQQATVAGLVEELAFGYLRGAHPLVVDAASLGGGAFTVPPDGAPWEGAGLEAVPARAGVLLTSKRQAEAWGAALPADVEKAVARAASSGREPSGRFASALEWLHGAGTSSDWREAEAYVREGWSAWTPLAGGEQEAALTVVHANTVTGAGAGLAVILLAGLAALRRAAGGARLRWLIGAMAVSGLALAWLPSSLLDLARWPLVAGLVLAVPVVLTFAAPGRHAPSTVGSRRSVAASVAGSLLLAIALRAQPGGAADVVFLVGAGAEQAVLLPPALQKKLQALAQSEGTGAGAVLASARYEGRVSSGVAEFDAVFHLHALGEGPSMAEIPLDGVQIVGDVLLDGAKALPRALAAPKAGYALAVSGKGPHKAQMRFRVPVADEGGMRSVRLAVPRLLQSQLSFLGPASATHLHAPTRQGAQATRAEGGGQRLEADLGAITGPLVLRWHQDGKAAKPAKATFREAHVWDLRPEGASLTSVVRYTLEGGSASLSLDIPAELAVRSASARRPRGSADAPARLSAWSLSPRPGGSVLKLEFPAPVSGEIEAEVELAPRGPLAGAALLPLPRPHGEPGPGLGHVAYRAPGLEANRAGLVGLTGIVPEKFAADWPAGSRPSTEGLAYAGTFRPGTPPQLKVEARPRAAAFEAEHRVRYDIGPRQAALSARVKILPAGASPPVLEWDLGAGRGVLVSSVEGPGVGAWSQSGHRLLVWMDRGATEIEIDGWVPLASGPTRLELPCLRPLGASRVRTAIELVPEGGQAVTAQDLSQLVPASRALSYEAKGRDHGGTFLVRPGPVPSARVATRAEVRGAWLEFESSLDCLLPGDGRSLTVRLRGWPGDAGLAAPPNAVMRRQESSRRGPGRHERTWRLEIAPGTSRVALTVKGRLPLEEASHGLPMPDVSAGLGERLLSVGAGLEAVGASGLAPGAGGGWRVRDEDWSLRLLPLAAPRGPEPVVLLAQVASTVPDGKRWTHEATWWLAQEGPAEVRIALPSGASLVSAEVDGAPAQAAQPERGLLALALPVPKGNRTLRIRYRRDDGREGLSRPEPVLPVLEGAQPGPVIWGVEVPAGWELAAMSSPALPPALARAAVELHLGRAEPGAAMAVAATRLRLAELALEDSQPLGPEGQRLAEMLKEGKRDPARASLLGSAAGEPAGDVRRWLGSEPPTVRLRSVAGSRPEQAIGATFQWLALWFLLWAASLSARLRTAGRWLWPELLLAAGLAGWHWHGPSLAVVMLVGLAVAARGLLLVAGVRRLMRPARRRPA